MFEYFPANYPWSMSVVTVLDMGGILSEVDDVCRPLRDVSPDQAIDACGPVEAETDRVDVEHATEIPTPGDRHRRR